MSRLPIAEHALLSDCHSSALVSRSGSVEWLCHSRFDSPSSCARLLDDDAGPWSITPVGDFEATRRYVDRSTRRWWRPPFRHARRMATGGTHGSATN